MKFTFPPDTRVLDGYTIKRAIYRGGFGEVYYALSDSGREVALKLLQNNTEVELRGVQQCLNLSHPNLVTIFDVRQDGDGDHWIIMEYVSGETLDAAVRRFPDGMPMEQVRKWLPGIAAGVSFLHSRGLVHRDLKPANVFHGDVGVKVGDVGLSKFIAPSRRSANTQSVGTVYYMAPEVARGRYGKEVDVYALGIMLYEMLTGRVPFDGESTGEILMKHLSERPALDRLPPRIRPVIAKALEKDPAKRFHSVADLAAAFDAAVLGKDPGAPSAEPGRPERGTSRGALGARREFGCRGDADHNLRSLLPSGSEWGGILIAGITSLLVCDYFGADGVREGLVWTMIGLAIGYLVIVMRRASGSRGLFSNARSVRDWHPSSATDWGIVALLALLILGNTRHDASQAAWIFWCAAGYFVFKSTARRRSRRLPTGENAGADSLVSLDVSPGAEVPRPAHSLKANPVPAPPAAAVPQWPKTYTFHARLLNWLTMAVLTTPLVALLTAGIALVSPSMLAANGNLTPANLVMFASTAIIGTWLVGFAAKATEGLGRDRGEQASLQRMALVAAGLLTGAAAWGCGEFLQLNHSGLYAGQDMDGLFARLGEGTLLAGDRQLLGPTLLGYMVFFSGLFGLRAWGKHIDPLRSNRFSINSTILTVLVSLLWSGIFSFPQTWGVLWAAVMSATTQVAAPWGSALPRSVKRG